MQNAPYNVTLAAAIRTHQRKIAYKLVEFQEINPLLYPESCKKSRVAIDHQRSLLSHALALMKNGYFHLALQALSVQ
jgi:hypothetical protein